MARAHGSQKDGKDTSRSCRAGGWAPLRTGHKRQAMPARGERPPGGRGMDQKAPRGPSGKRCNKIGSYLGLKTLPEGQIYCATNRTRED